MILHTTDIVASLTQWLGERSFDKRFLLVDENTERLCLPRLAAAPWMAETIVIRIAAGDDNKTLDALQSVWLALGEGGASRHSLLINLGGGMVTDLGGFAAATFKRGIACVNIPTTLLGTVDAAVGGKTGINFCGLKNEIGVFAQPQAVIIDGSFLETLSRSELLSGFAEMVKHGLLSDEEHLGELLAFDWDAVDYARLGVLATASVRVKEAIVAEDPTEQGIRMALNLGHTVGHALESFSHARHTPIPHGYAVIFGTLCELYISYKLLGFPSAQMQRLVAWVREWYSPFAIDCAAYDAILDYMLHDKKNLSGEIRFALLSSVGEIAIKQVVSKELILESLDYYRESFGL